MKQFDGFILALDLAGKTGWAHGKPGQPPTFGSLRFTKSGSSRASLYRAFRLWLDHVWGAHDHLSPDLIVYESPASPMIMQGRTQIETIKRLIGMAEHLEEWAHQRVELREASVSQVRIHFLGTNHIKRDAAKLRTIEQCQRFGWMVTDDNEADACALWSYQVACLRPDIAARMTPLFYGRTGKVINQW